MLAHSAVKARLQYCSPCSFSCLLQPAHPGGALSHQSLRRRHRQRLENTLPQAAASPRTSPDQESALDTIGCLERSLAQPSTSRPVRKGTVPPIELAVQGDKLQSSWNERLIVWAASGLMVSLFAKGATEVTDFGGAVAAGVAVVTAYLLADLGTGVYHWGVDNYGDGSTPVFGTQIAAFQGHHQQPWTITQREFCNNVSKLFAPSIPFSLAFLGNSGWTPAWFDLGMSTFLGLVCLSQQFHSWAHTKKSELPQPVITLQDAGLLISRRAHGAHHKAPFEGNYCIVSGIWNPVLDADGSEQRSFWRRLERFFHHRTGIEPRCWHEPKYEWQVQLLD